MNTVTNIQEAKSRKVQWHTITFLVIFHVMSVFAIFTFSWQNIAAMAITWWVAGSLGIGLGYHRLLTHRGFKTPKWFEYFLALCGTTAIQSGPLSWVTTHRLHHAFTDKEKDPHSPTKSFFWGHMGWLMRGSAQEHTAAEHKRYSPDLHEDKFYLFLEKYFWAANIPVAIVLFAIGGWSMVIWGVFFRTVWGWHTTWLVNSACHVWGGRRFETTDDSRNNPVVGIMAFGEGWHNNHHAYPRSARHGLTWYEFDINWIQIRIMETIGLIKNVYAVDLNKPKYKAKIFKKAA
jgi:stearoyl-CoA desaturase (delta-9 desaturase)